MANRPAQSITKHFASVQDPHLGNAKLYRLSDILVIAICTAICGADTCVGVEHWVKANRQWLRSFLELRNGILSHDTFGCAFDSIPNNFDAAFWREFMRSTNSPLGRSVAIDGKKTTMEMFFGKELSYNEKYPGASKLARLLALFESQLKLEQPGSGSHWYVAHSTTTYFQEYVAATQARQLWDRSEIGRQHGLGKIIQARYGFEELETHYCTWLGALENPEEPYAPSRSRDEYVKDLAEEETLIYALNVDRFRAELKLSKDLFSGEKILSILHHRRARSTYVPAKAREESIRWLNENEDEKDSG